MSANPTPHRILIVEDESDMARVLQFNLSRQGHEVDHAASLAAAAERLAGATYQLILLDLRLPDGSGLDFLADQQGLPPVVVVSAHGDETTVVEALNRGAEDFVTKPFRIRELLARVSGTLRRHAPAAVPVSDEIVENGGLRLDLASHEATSDGEPAPLTRSEFRLVLHFLRHPGRVLTRTQLCDEALEAGGSVQERTIDAHIRTIRRKLGNQGQRIATVWGVGYRLLEPGDEE
ncbi:MAG: response regulator transcription factor [Lentisphaeria bacterium]|jgi:DNA-binding response OmpR family regulator|nr:response regulator transcription factor [Lentisphaeria bacterium]